MATIAVLGATSQIAKDYIFFALQTGHTLKLFSRRPAEVATWLGQVAPAKVGDGESLGYDCFGMDRYNVIINFVGSGDPARIAKMGAEIFDVTETFDRLACDALKRAPDTRYVFLSSGAAYGSAFLEPATGGTQAKVSINAFSPQEYYSVAKLYAEARHRALTDLAIIDIRVFGYFSRTVDLAARFFLTDILRAIRDGEALTTDSASMQRDFLIPDDFNALVGALLNTPPANAAVDAYSKAPVEKFELLETFKAEFGLNYRVTSSPPIPSATGAKPHYYSLNHCAETYGYHPRFTALEGVIAESKELLRNLRQTREYIRNK